MQGVDNLFEVDTVQNIMKHIMEIAGVKYHEDEKKDVSLRVITDHIRSTTFMIGDGVMPSNEGRGYVLRRLLRRAARHGRLLGIDGTFLYKVCETVIKENAAAYPNLVEKHDLIVKVIKAEEESFNKTIDTGLNLLENIIARSDSKVLSGADAFKLQDTFGFPIDLTKELLDERGMSVDIDRVRPPLRSEQSGGACGAQGCRSSGVEGQQRFVQGCRSHRVCRLYRLFLRRRDKGNSHKRRARRVRNRGLRGGRCARQDPVLRRERRTGGRHGRYQNRKRGARGYRCGQDP